MILCFQYLDNPRLRVSSYSETTKPFVNWHRRVMADEVVAHAFSHGFHHMSSDSPLTGRRQSVARPRIPIPMVTRPP